MDISVLNRQSPKVPSLAPENWRSSCLNSENSLHQLSPYIGKLKSTIAHDLITDYSKPKDLIIEPFCGAGTIALEAVLLNRRVFASDVSAYSRVLSLAKLRPPKTLQNALKLAKSLLKESESAEPYDIRNIPDWVQIFFHPETLSEIATFASVCRKPGREFFMACFLGILHHQRPGFLSYPSSHLVPYLRNKKFPPLLYPDMYAYRALRPRFLAKVERAYKRSLIVPKSELFEFDQNKVEDLQFPDKFDCLITSPPYMNTLDYSRDNRLRLWFINPRSEIPTESSAKDQKANFISAISATFRNTEYHLKSKKYCIIIVGERISRAKTISLSEYVCDVANQEAPSLKLAKIIRDDIPDIRRARRYYTGTKSEHILVFRKK